MAARRSSGATARYLGGAPAYPDAVDGYLGLVGDRLVFAAPGGERLAIPLGDLLGLSLSTASAPDEAGVRRVTLGLAVGRDDAAAVVEFAIERRQASALRMLIERALEATLRDPLPRVEHLAPKKKRRAMPEPPPAPTPPEAPAPPEDEDEDEMAPEPFVVEAGPELEPELDIAPPAFIPEKPPPVEPPAEAPPAQPGAPPGPPTLARAEAARSAEGEREPRGLGFFGPLLVVTVPTLLLVAFAVLLIRHSGSTAVTSTAKEASDRGNASSQPVHPGWKPYRGPVPILMYHLVQAPIPSKPYPELFVKPADFKGQMEWLDKQGYEGVTLDQVEDAWYKHKTLPPKPVVVSFDDGYYSQFKYAFPVLQKLGWPGVIDLIAEGSDLPDDKVKEMIKAHWELASHTIHHADLTTLDPASMKEEVDGSRKELQRRFNVPVNNFCYPSGRYDDAAVEAVKAAGYRGATTVDPGLATRNEPFTLKRIRVSLSDGVSGFEQNFKDTLAGKTVAAPAGPA